jgi:hypothetical protein
MAMNARFLTMHLSANKEASGKRRGEHVEPARPASIEDTSARKPGGLTQVVR